MAVAARVVRRKPRWGFTLWENTGNKDKTQTKTITAVSSCIRDAIIAWSWCLRESKMIGWSHLGRRSNWNANQSVLSKATFHPINWHSLFRMIIYPGLTPRGAACECVCVCQEKEKPDCWVLFVTLSAGGGCEGDSWPGGGKKKRTGS